MPWTVIVLFVYGVFTIAMGLAGFIHGHSLPSLISGGIAGVLVLVAASLAKGQPKVGFGLALVVALLMIGRFMGPLMSKHQLYPAGIIVGASVVGIIAAIAGLLSPT